jgi:transcriptional regulator with XRE-family HTH domain
MKYDPDEVGENVRARIFAARVLRRMKLEDVEKETGLKAAYLSKLERGRLPCPRVDILVRLANAYDLPFEDFLRPLEGW